MTHPQHCPYLGLRADPTSIFTEPTEEHRCHAAERPVFIDADHQTTFCLSPDFQACPRFVPLPEPALAPAVEPAPAPNLDTGPADDVPPPPWPAFRVARFFEEYVGLELLLWAGITTVAIVAVLWYLTRPLPGSSAPSGAALADDEPSPSPTASLAATPVVPAGATLAPAGTPTPAPPTATLPAGRLVAALSPAGNAVGWVSSADRTNHFGDRNLHVGTFEDHTYQGAMQFSLASIPAGSRIEAATLELVGLNAENLGTGGTWMLRLLSPDVDADFPSATYAQIHEAPVADTIAPELGPGDLAARQTNVFTFKPAQLAELERRLSQGGSQDSEPASAPAVSFRLDGPSEGEKNLFTWDTGYGGGFGSRPVLRIVYKPPPTLTPIVVTATEEPPTPANVVTLAALAATATYQATAVGTPTPWPPNVVTATPPFVVTNTPTPGNVATAEWLAVVATSQAYLYGTPTPLPTDLWTATPVLPTVTPTPVPLLLFVDQMTPAPTATITPTPTSTPSELPALLTGKIAFLSNRFGGQQPAVMVVNPDGSGLAVLTNTWAYQRALALDSLSPDRKYQVLVQTRRESYPGSSAQVDDPQIWIQQLSDGWLWYLVGRLGGADYEPAWSPDGVHVAYVAQQAGNDEIFVIDKDTAEKRRLTNNEWEWDKHPSWSPDGTQLVFWSNRGEGGRQQIWIMNADGSDQRPLFQDEWNNWNPVWIK